uniref:Family with sequence similarity 184 member B n=1 Tax=Cairina moschata TaxID=8855 RepID=A0A8C3GHX3_CAIMO
MASGINKLHQPGTCNGSKALRSSSAEGCNKEIHMKMCKKIAQLTKVIYALNTKNDEHEASIQALRDAHEEEIQHILAETRETILQYKSKAEEEQLLRKHIEALEIAVEQHKRLKEEALAELTLCKQQVEERELRTEVQQAQMVLSTDTVDTNADFENKLLHLNQESEGLMNECKASRRQNLDRKDILDEKYYVKGQAVVKEMENLKSENQRAIKECTQKTSQLQASCKREKETLKKSMQQSTAETKNCQQREMEQRKSSEAKEGFLLQQVKKLEADLEEKSQKINERKKHSQKLKERIQVENLKDTENFNYLIMKHIKKIKLELQAQLEEFKRNSECEIKQLEKEKEALTVKLQNSSLEVTLRVYLNEGCNPSGNGEGPQERGKEDNVLWRREVNVLNCCEKELSHEVEGIHLVAQLKQILDQQANNFKESLKKHNLQSNKEKEKLLQDLQSTIKENQNVKLQLEASHQKVLKMLEKSKKQELKAEERLKKEFNETFKIQHQSHRLEMQTLEEKAKKELHDELEQIQKQQTLLLGSLRMELSEQQTSCTNLKKQIEELQMELKSVRTLKKQQARIQFLLHYLAVFSESSGITFISPDIVKVSHRNSAIFLSHRLNELEEKTRKQESRPEDIQLISCLQDKLSEREELIKQLVEGRKFHHLLLANTESYRNRSFSFNPTQGCLTPSTKKRPVEVPSRVVSVPNLASYAKSLLNCDLRSKRSAQITKSTSLDRSPSCLQVGSPPAQTSDSSAATRYLSVLK